MQLALGCLWREPRLSSACSEVSEGSCNSFHPILEKLAKDGIVAIHNFDGEDCFIQPKPTSSQHWKSPVTGAINKRSFLFRQATVTTPQHTPKMMTTMTTMIMTLSYRDIFGSNARSTWKIYHPTDSLETLGAGDSLIFPTKSTRTRFSRLPTWIHWSSSVSNSTCAINNCEFLHCPTKRPSIFCWDSRWFVSHFIASWLNQHHTSLLLEKKTSNLPELLIRLDHDFHVRGLPQHRQDLAIVAQIATFQQIT